MKRTFDSLNSGDHAFAPGKVHLVERNCQPVGIKLVNFNLMARKNPTDLVELAMEIEKADSFIHANASNKLQVIAQQQQARDVLMETKINLELHHVPCNFVKVPGNIYHLYKRPNGQVYLGMLSPQEWVNCPHEHLGSYRLEHDQSWTPIDEISEKDKELGLISSLLSTNDQAGLRLALQDTSMDM